MVRLVSGGAQLVRGVGDQPALRARRFVQRGDVKSSDATGSAASSTNTPRSHEVTEFRAPTGWGLPRRPVVTDAGYGDNTAFRLAL